MNGTILASLHAPLQRFPDLGSSESLSLVRSCWKGEGLEAAEFLLEILEMGRCTLKPKPLSLEPRP